MPLLLSHLEISMSMAPPPATTAELFSARRTIMMASCSERSASSMNWSLPPRRTMVAVRALGQPLNRLYLSAPTCKHKPQSLDTQALLTS